MSNLEIFHANIEKEFAKAGIKSKFTIFKTADVKNPKVIINVSVFRMPDPYKDESLYIDGLSLLLDNLDKTLKNCVLRIYYDDSVTKKDDKWKPIIEKAKTKKFVQMVHYDFPQFKKLNGSFYHEGVFGTIVRFFSLFNFSNVNEAVSIIDIDFNNLAELNLVSSNITKGLKFMKSSKTTFLFNTYGFMAYLSKPRLLISDLIQKYEFTLRMVTQPTTCIKKLDVSIIVDFMLCILNRCPLYNKWLDETIDKTNCKNVARSNNHKRIQQCRYFNEIKNMDIGMFAFGVDELFLNTMILEDFLKNKLPFIVIYEMPSMTHYHFALYKRFQRRGISVQFMIDMYYAILGRKLHNVQDIYQAFAEVDKFIYMNEGAGGIIIQTAEAKKIYTKIYNFLQPRNGELLALPNLEIYEKMMFEYLKNTKEEDFIIGKYFYKVKYFPNNKYELVRLSQ